MKRTTRLAALAAALLLAGCGPASTAGVETPPAEPSVTPFLPVRASATPQAVRLWIDPAVPAALRAVFEGASDQTASVVVVEDRQESNLRLEPGGERPVARWTYVVVAPFPTVADGIALGDLRAAWKGVAEGSLPVYMNPTTEAAIKGLLGRPGAGVRTFEDPEDLVTFAWAARPSLGIVPFEDLEVRWKVMSVDGRSPLHPDFDDETDPLTVSYGLSGDETLSAGVEQAVEAAQGEALPLRNRRVDRMTTVVMTGVTALVRATAWQMDRMGTEFPARDIGDWLRSGDITHISHEVAFTPDCPPAEPQATNLIFCASPAHAGLFTSVGADVIELTGNHVLDAGVDALRYTLDLYREQGLLWFGGGEDAEQARQPVRLEHHGNRIAFVGCNEAGPPGAWAGETQPGANPCGAERLGPSVARLVGEGYLPIATFQWHEHYTPVPPASQREAFRAAADAGAVGVSGSQAHQPQGFEFRGGSLIHYGLGNLFFDQMWSIAVRKEFIDRYVFHAGRLISVELQTAYLEDWARPRPMTPEERAQFLSEIFEASGW